MVFRVATANPNAEGLQAWEVLAPTQHVGEAIGYISQPAHAVLAGMLAVNLTSATFGVLPAEVIDAISKHDTGWAMSDLNALEHAAERRPESFIESEARAAVSAWRRSICEARKRSALAGVLTSRHFCMLAPKDDDAVHQEFVRSEGGSREVIESKTNFTAQELDRYTAALGFCDLLSLLLCSGVTGTYHLPLAHPSDPASSETEQLGFTVSDSSLKCERRFLLRKVHVSVAGWLRTQDGMIIAHRFDWEVE